MSGERDIIAAIEAAEDAGPPEGRPISPLDRACAGLLRNDLGNAERLIARFGDQLRYLPGLDWLAWDGRRWDSELGPLVAQQKAQATSRAIYAEARAVEEAAPDLADIRARAMGAGADDKRADQAAADARRQHSERVKALVAWACTSGNQGKVSAMLNEAMPHLVASPADFDSDPHVFNAADKAVLLGREIRLRPHARADRCTLIGGTNASAAIGAPCPAWTAFLERVQPDPEMRAYLQRLVGYCLTGSIQEQVMFVFHGQGRNGKSTFLKALRAILGSYAVTAKTETFAAGEHMRSGQGASPDVARLRAVRLVITTDTSASFRLDEGLVKQATSEEPMVARRLHREPVEFSPAFKLIIPCNQRPIIRGSDEGTWRRVQLVPWDQYISDAEVDRGLGAKLAAEAEGILGWALEGAAAWYRRGLDAPEAVKAATADYRETSDVVVEFMGATTERVAATERVGASALYDLYCHWSKANGLEPISGTAFGKRLPMLGVQRVKSGGNNYYIGVRIVTQDASPNPPSGGEGLPETGRVCGYWVDGAWIDDHEP